jgi:hypothetical protein
MADLSVLARLATAGSAVAGLIHLLIPGRLLSMADWGYDRILAVDFQPRENATRRVRLIGAAMLLGSVVVARLRSWLE